MFPKPSLLSLCRVPFRRFVLHESNQRTVPGGQAGEACRATEGSRLYDDRESYYTSANRELDAQASNAIAQDNWKDALKATANQRREMERERYKGMELFRAEQGLTFDRRRAIATCWKESG